MDGAGRETRDLVRRKVVAGLLETFIKAHTGPGGDTVSDIASYLGMTRKALDHRMHGPRGQGPTPLGVHELVALTLVLEDGSLMQAVCRQAGGYFVPNPHEQGESRPEAAWDYAMGLFAAAVRESGEALEVSAEALRDRVVTVEEKEAIRREIGEIIHVFTELQSALESMPGPGPVRKMHLGEAG